MPQCDSARDMAMTVCSQRNAAAVVTQGGGLWVFGDHRRGSLGLGLPVGEAISARQTAVLLGGVRDHVTELEGGGAAADARPFGNEPLVMVAAGFEHMAAVTDSGRVWVWGPNGRSQLGVEALFQGPGSCQASLFRWGTDVYTYIYIYIYICTHIYTYI